MTWSVAKSPRVAEECDVNIYSFTHPSRLGPWYWNGYVAQQPMKARAYCAHPSIRAEVYEQMSRSGGQSEARPPVFLNFKQAWY
ncbi:hypothetical protein TNCV_4206131 [Trichonephila clavipes]|nr:hypothetical protein TNCV_4206131 [Trichonephila clavipes]